MVKPELRLANHDIIRVVQYLSIYSTICHIKVIDDIILWSQCIIPPQGAFYETFY